MTGKNTFFFILIISVFLFIFTACVQNESKKTKARQQSDISALLDSEIKYLESSKENLNIYQQVSIKGETEKKQQDAETVKKALETLKEMDIDRLIKNPSFEKTSQNLINSQKSSVIEENFILKEGERSPVKRFTIYYNNSGKNPENIIAFYILKHTKNRLFTSSQSHYLKFKNSHLKQVEMKGTQQIIFSDPIDFRSNIEITN